MVFIYYYISYTTFQRYNTKLIADEAARLVKVHTVEDPFYMYLAFMAVHDGCSQGTEFTNLGKQAPMSTVDLYVGAPRGPLHGGRSTRAAPRGSLHEGRSTGGVADLFYTDVRSILMVL